MTYSLRNIIIGCVAIAAILLLIIAITFSTLTSQQKELAKISKAREAMKKIGEALNDLQELESVSVNYLNTGDDNLVPVYSETLKRVQADHTNMTSLGKTAGAQRKYYQQLADALQDMTVLAADNIRWRRTYAGSRSKNGNAAERRLSIITVAKENAERLEVQNRAVLENAYGHSLALTRRTVFYVIVISALLLVLLAIGFHFIRRDISSKKRSELQLKKFNEELEMQVRAKTAEILENSKRARSIIEQASDAIMITDATGNFLEVNTALSKKFGYTQDELTRMNINQLIDPQQLENDPIQFEKLLAGHAIFRERRMMHKDGHIIEVEANVKMLPDKTMLAIARDITGRKKAEEEKERVRYLLNERVKELTTLYRCSQILQSEDNDLEHMLKEIVNILPGGWQFTGITVACITIGHLKVCSTGYRKGVHTQIASFATPDKGPGTIEVAYLEEQQHAFEDVFLSEERDLLNMVAEMIRISLARKHEAILLKKSEAELTEQKVEAQKMITRAVLKAEENERNKIGQELHDNVNQILASIKLFLTIIEKKGIDAGMELVQNASNLIEEAIQEIRLLSKRYVTPLKEINLEDSIQSLLDNLSDNTEIKASFIVNNYEQSIEDDLKLNVYRVVQEQINNIVKHAQASNIEVTLNADYEFLYLSVQDDGNGFDITQRRKGIGISNMMNRIESYNGNLTIESSPGKGCRMEIKIPLPEEEIA